ncbi:MAG TPA: NifU family protein [Candidatus Limnocylindrales bacterium]|nr:NifU family protein [Candidatus Limnocylindrales bacterium]
MITVTEVAREKVLELMQKTGKPIKGLRVIAEAKSPLKVEHRLLFIVEGQEQPEDIVVPVEGFDIYIDPQSAQYLENATLDYVDNIMSSGFKIDAPKKLPAHLTGPVAQRIQQLIDTRINPAIAAHGGYVSLIDIKDNVVYVQLGGGCQGCGMVDVTLKQGIEVMIKEEVPEITQVLDVTDHAGGKNPYYQPSK